MPALSGFSSQPRCSLLFPGLARQVRAPWELERGGCEPERWPVMGGTLESHQFAGIVPGVGGWTGTPAV